ncbi:MAG TPA: MBG domain-containing protein [Hyphomicrobiales bacterium]|nr:MBG domain-containing protein [Hyphomicrobiales bacterium]
MVRADTHFLAALMATTALAGAPAAVAAELPGGASVVAGQVAIGNPSGDTLRIRQSSDSGIVNWNSFSIGAGDRVLIRQPSSDAALLNRVTGATPSTIAGQLKANGQVFLVNPNGIAITKSGVVQTGAFVGSSLDISDDDFMAGKRGFAGNGHSAAVTNAGRITAAPDGYAALIGGRVANDGVIDVPLGKIGLGAGERATLDLSGDGFLQVALPSDTAGKGALIRERGQLRANGGRIEIQAATARDAARNAINLSGLAEARSVTGRPGAIVLGGGAGGKVRISGRLDVSAERRQHGVMPLAQRRGRQGVHLGGSGGSITVTGAEIALHHAHLDASGSFVPAVLAWPPLPIDGGGGEVRIGGDEHGAGPLPNATTVTVDRASTIRADGLGVGNGGTVVVWSDGATSFSGKISARGGAFGGDGGFAEVSGHVLAYHGMADLRAPEGAIGTILFDPSNVIISTGTTTGNLAGGTFTPTGDDSVLNATDLLNALATANVTVTTTSGQSQPGNISVEAPLTWSAATTLTLAADGGIAIDRAITATAGGLTLNAGFGQTISATAAVNIGGVFDLVSGNWVQNTATLPAFSAFDFTLDGGTFQRFAGGDGAGTPYRLVDIYGVQGIRTSPALLDSNYVLANDIDASGTANWNSGQGFAPIGNDDIGFQGVFNGISGGTAHVISGLTIKDPLGFEVGMFGQIDFGGLVENFALTGVSVTGGDTVGGLAGRNENGSISNVIVSGTVTGVDNVGGLVGDNVGVEAAVGASIFQSISKATVNGSGSDIGGLVGENHGTFGAPATIEQSYATGAVKGGAGSSDVGGLVGLMDTDSDSGSAATIDQSYATGAVSGAADVGGLVGVTVGAGVGITASFWDTQATGQASATSAGGAVAGATGLTTADFQNLTVFVTEAQSQGWDFEDDWSPPSNVAGNAFYPELYTMEPVIRQVVDPNPTSTYGNAPVLANNGTIGGPGTYIFGPAGDGVTFGPGALTTTATSTSSVGSYPIAGALVSSTLGVTYNTVATMSGAAGASVIPQIVVNPRPLTVTADPESKTYGDAFTFGGTEFSTTGLVNGDTVTSVDLASAGAPATATVAGGPYTITAGNATGTGLGNYAISYVTGLLTVDTRALTITANSLSKTYGDAFTFGGTEFSTSAGLVNGDTVTSVDLASAGAPATATVAGGPYAITASNAAGTGIGNYAITYVPGALSVTPKALTVTADDLTKTYGDTLTFAGTEFTSAGLVNGDTITGVDLASSGAGKTATVTGGPYAIAASNAAGTGLGNYTISYAPGSLSVTPKALTITADDLTKTYGDTLTFAGTEFTSAGLVNGDTVTSVDLASAGAGKTATVAGGPYAITASNAAGTGLGNYAITYAPGALSVTPKALTVTADDLTKTYGDSLTFAGTEFSTSAGLVNGDTVTSVDLASAGAPATATVAGGPYAITASNAAGAGIGNYAITYVPGALTVTPKALTVTADDLTKTYGDTLTFAGTEFTSAGLVNGDTITGVDLASSGAGKTATVAGGPYAIAASNAAGTGLGNYAITYKAGTLTVNPAALTITADDLAKTYGDKLTFAGTEFTATGLKNADAVAGVTLTSAGAKASATVAGSPYAITASSATGTGLGNYTITYAPGALAVNKAALTVTADNETKVSGTSFAFAGTEFTVAGLKNADAVTSATITSAGASADATVAGSPYAIAISNAKGTGLANYTIAYVPGAFTVTPEATTTAILPISPGTGPIYDPPDIIPTTFGGGGGGGPIISLPGTPLPPTLTVVRQTVTSLNAELAACERRHSHEGRQVYIECLANALDGFATTLDRHVLELPPPLRQVAAAIHRAAARVRAAHSVAEARAAVSGAIAEVRKVLVLLRAGEPTTTRLEGNAIVSALQSVDARLLRATGL